MRTGGMALDELSAALVAQGAEPLEPDHGAGERHVAALHLAHAGRSLRVWESRAGRAYLCRYWQKAGSTSTPARAADAIMAILPAAGTGWR